MRYDIDGILKKHWGYDNFRSLQRSIITSVLDGHDTLGLMPTGGGKSITFQVPGLALEGLTLVVTPLISLMKDQVDNLTARGLRAAYIHSGLTFSEMRRVWDKVMNGNCRFLYVLPERLQNERFRLELKSLKKIRLIVVDEAHCISQWGHDFRPAYLQIASLRKLMPQVPVLALTASATPEVQDDICRSLQFKNHNVFKAGYKRDNITYVVRHVDGKIEQMCRILDAVPGSAIVYVRSRRRTVELASTLCAVGIEALPYHAGLDHETKEQRQNSWKSGATRVMVATNAFGMGIDKPDVRVVIHHDMPGSLEEYYQEAGRAGRDGNPSYAVMLITDKDKSILRRRISESFPERDTIRQIYRSVCNYIGIAMGEGYQSIREFDIMRFCSIHHFQEMQVRNALSLLAASGYLELIENPQSTSRVMITCDREELYSLPDADARADSVLRALLRTYPGLFTDYVGISENKLSSLTSLSAQELYDTLLSLNRSHILNYIPRKNIPYIYVLTSREDIQNMIIPCAVYEDRRDVMKRRIDAIINYAYSNDTCHSRFILEYFGDDSPVDCGRCEICRKKKKTSLPADGKQKLIEFISSSSTGVTEKDIVRRYGNKASQALAELTYLVGEGYVHRHDGIYTTAS